MDIQLNLKGGEKLQKFMDKITENINGGDLAVGFLSGATCGMDNDAPAPSVAYWNEFGTERIPARPFFRTAIALNAPRWGKLLGAAMINTKFHRAKTLNTMGLVIVAQIQKQIEQTTEPVNAPRYRKYKMKRYGFAKVLEVSKNLKRAVDYRID